MMPYIYLYVNTKSNHPPSILKNIPEAINRRLSNLSSDENMFNEVAPIYQKALENAGYKFKLKYTPQQKQKKKNNKNRKREVCWWNPPFSENVKTKVGAKFFKLLDTHFPEHSPLRKIINKNTVKMSYRTTPNFRQIIAAHNAKILKGGNPDPPCNCRTKSDCPLKGKCGTDNVVYQCIVTTQENPPKVETYLGMTAPKFKARYSNHKQSHENEKYKTQTTLSQHIWELKAQNIPHSVEWKIIDRAKPFSPITGVCSLCTLEKFYIMTKPELATLNKNHEIYKPCLHRKSCLMFPKR